MIRAVTLGVLCLAGLGAIAAAAKRTTEPPSFDIVYPAVVGEKADRLAMTNGNNAPVSAEILGAVSVVRSEKDRAAANPVQEGIGSIAPPAPGIVARHWHDPYDPKLKRAKSGATSRSQPRKRLAGGTAKRITEIKECRSDGLDPLLRKLSLAPACRS